MRLAERHVAGPARAGRRMTKRRTSTDPSSSGSRSAGACSQRRFGSSDGSARARRTDAGHAEHPRARVRADDPRRGQRARASRASTPLPVPTSRMLRRSPVRATNGSTRSSSRRAARVQHGRPVALVVLGVAVVAGAIVLIPRIVPRTAAPAPGPDDWARPRRSSWPTPPPSGCGRRDPPRTAPLCRPAERRNRESAEPTIAGAAAPSASASAAASAQILARSSSR